MLLQRGDVSPDTTDDYGRTPLSWAAANGREGIVKILLDRENVTPDSADKDGRTPLLWAADNGHERIVEILLELGNVTPDAPDKRGQTPLLSPAQCNHLSVVGMLPEQFALSQNIVMTDLTGPAPVSLTSEYQHGQALKRRFEDQGLDPQVLGRNSSTSLFPPARSESSQHPSKKTRRS